MAVTPDPGEYPIVLFRVCINIICYVKLNKNPYSQVLYVIQDNRWLTWHRNASE